MARYIDAETIANKIEELTNTANITQRQDDVTEKYKNVHKGMVSAYNHCRNIILDAPTADVVKVVRCKDCKNYVTRENAPNFCMKRRTWISETDFCSYGERRDT